MTKTQHDSETLAEREISEEFGMHIAVGDCFYSFTDPIENIKLNPEDHAEYRWLAQNELQSAFTQNKQADMVPPPGTASPIPLQSSFSKK